VPALAAAFLAEFGRDLGKGALELSEPAAAALQRYHWPGNVRELRNVMERAAVLAVGEQVDAALVDTLLPATEREAVENLDLNAALGELERKMILRALVATQGRKTDAAALLGIGERTLWTKLKKHGL
jgi:DNA-binding NtrC family response regulator